jgi:hypothetical protein
MSLRLAEAVAEAVKPLDSLSEAAQSFLRAALAAAPAPVRNALDGTRLGAPLHPR